MLKIATHISTCGSRTNHIGGGDGKSITKGNGDGKA